MTGSAYTFVYITFGELAAWLIGWNLTLGYGISAGIEVEELRTLVLLWG